MKMGMLLTSIHMSFQEPKFALKNWRRRLKKKAFHSNIESWQVIPEMSL